MKKSSWPLYDKHPCEVKLKGGPAAGMTVVMPFSSEGGLWFVYSGKTHHYRGVPGRPGTTLDYVGDGSMGISPLGIPTGIPVKDQ
jgi:hypothetical protein